MKDMFTTLNTIIEEMEHEDSDLTYSDEDNKQKSYFQFEGKSGSKEWTKTQEWQIINALCLIKHLGKVLRRCC